MIEFKKGLNGFFDSLLPEKQRKALDVNSLSYIRARTLSAMLVIATLLTLISTVLLVSIHAIFYWDQLRHDVVVTGITLSFALQTWIYYRFCNYALSAFILCNYYFVMVLALTLASGGYDSETSVLLFICPIIFFVLCDIRQGVSSSVIVVIIGILLSILKSQGFEFPDQFSDTSPHITLALSWALAIVALALCATFYDVELQKST